MKTPAKKIFVGYYLPPELMKWVKLQAVEEDAQPSHVIEQILTEARSRAGGRK